MKLGFITAILDSWTYEEMMDFASEQGFECVEVACWAYRGICKKIRSGDLVTGLLSKRDGGR